MVKYALVLCVRRPVDGLPVPNAPVNVSVNVPCAAFFAANTETVIGTAPPTATELELKVHVVLGCGSLHVIDTVPVKPTQGNQSKGVGGSVP
jgi:hypothetical protein